MTEELASEIVSCFLMEGTYMVKVQNVEVFELSSVSKLNCNPQLYCHYNMKKHNPQYSYVP